jgi:hypothetical protein
LQAAQVERFCDMTTVTFTAGSKSLARLTVFLILVPACRKGKHMKSSVTGCVAAAVLFAMAAVGPTAADAGNRPAWAAGVIGGMSANEILGWPSPYYGYYPASPAPAHYAAPAGPPPGCVIRQQKVWAGYGWRWRKLRICH